MGVVSLALVASTLVVRLLNLAAVKFDKVTILARQGRRLQKRVRASNDDDGVMRLHETYHVHGAWTPGCCRHSAPHWLWVCHHQFDSSSKANRVRGDPGGGSM